MAVVGTASENFAGPLTLPCQVESRGYYIDAADYRAEPPFAQYILRATPRLSRYVKYLTEFQRGISNGTIDRSHHRLQSDTGYTHARRHGSAHVHRSPRAPVPLFRRPTPFDFPPCSQTSPPFVLSFLSDPRFFFDFARCANTFFHGFRALQASPTPF